MRISFPKISLSRILIMVCIVAYFAFGDYSRYVYVIKVAAIVGLVISEKRIHMGFHLFWVIGFLMCEAVSMLWCDYISNSLFYIVWTLQAMALAFVMGNAVHTKKDIEYVLKCIFIGGVVLSLRVLAHTTVRELGSFRVGENMGYNANELAMKCAVACNAGFYSLIRQRKRSTRIAFTLFAALTLLIVIFTGSRKGVLMAVMGLILSMTFRSKAPIKFLRNVFIAIGLMAVFFVVVTQVEAFNKVLGRRLMLIVNLLSGESYVGNSITNRLNFARIGLELFTHRPLIGYGTGSFAYVSGVGLYAHNNYVQLLVDLGLMGTLVYYSVYAYNITGLIRIMRREKELCSMLLSFALMLLALELTLVSFQNDYVQLIIALSCAYIRLDRENRGSLEELE